MAEDQVQIILRELAVINQKLDNALKVQDDHESRLRDLEGKGGKRWESLVGQFIGLLAAGAAGWFLGQI